MGYLLPFNRNIPRTQDFGNIQNNAIIKGGPHGGDDYGTPVGTPVRAAGNGVIDYAGVFDDSYADNYAWNTSMAGLLVWLNCGDNEPSFEYGHLSRVLVKQGDRVKRGQVIAITGNSGGSTGPHCHVGCLPPGYDLNTPTFGRVNPRIYMTEYYEDIPTKTEDDEKMLFLMKAPNDSRVWIGDGIVRRHIPDPQTLEDIRYRFRIGELKLANKGEIIEGNVELAGKAV